MLCIFCLQADEDGDWQQDVTSIAISFDGFSSPACGIRGYEWAVGSEPGWSDVLPYTSVGIVMLNESQGHAQIHLPLHHGQILYASVRAHLGKWMMLISCQTWTTGPHVKQSNLHLGHVSTQIPFHNPKLSLVQFSLTLPNCGLKHSFINKLL